jgi:hypothetical protein
MENQDFEGYGLLARGRGPTETATFSAACSALSPLDTFQLLLEKAALEEGHGFTRAINEPAVDGFSR